MLQASKFARFRRYQLRRALPSIVETADRSEPATAGADPVVAELEAALAMRLAGADAKTLRRTLRRIEELLDE